MRFPGIRVVMRWWDLLQVGSSSWFESLPPSHCGIIRQASEVRSIRIDRVDLRVTVAGRDERDSLDLRAMRLEPSVVSVHSAGGRSVDTGECKWSGKSE